MTSIAVLQDGNSATMQKPITVLPRKKYILRAKATSMTMTTAT